MMKCKSCALVIDTDSEKYLVCFECNGKYHLSCLDKVTENDYEFLTSSASNFKCAVCINTKNYRGDDTPLSPVTEKLFFPPHKTSDDTENESTHSDKSSRNNPKIICSKCKKGFSYNAHKALCLKCNGRFHFNCISMSKEDYMKVKASWLCSCCSVKSDMTVAGRQHAGAPLSADKTRTEVTIADVLKEMMSFRAEITTSQREMKENLEKYSEWIEEYGTKIDTVNIKLGELTQEVANYKQENVNLKKEVSQLTEKVNILEQALKENTVEIHGVPEEEKENVMEVLAKISSVIGFDFNESKIDNCYRYKSTQPSSGRSNGIVVRFTRKIDMEQFMFRRREKRNLNSRDLGFVAGNATPVYINESLTQANRKLLNAARAVKREKGYTYLWVKNGRIFMRKNPGDRFVIISSFDDLKTIN